MALKEKTPTKKVAYQHITKVPAALAKRSKANLKRITKQLFQFREGDKAVVQKIKPMNVVSYLKDKVSSAPYVLSASNADSFTSWANNKLSLINQEFESDEDAERAKQVKEYMGGLLTAARGGDDASWKTLAAIIRVNTGRLLQGSGGWAQYFDIRHLAHNDKVYLHNEVPNEIKVDVIGEDGGVDEVQPQRQKNVEFVKFFRISSDVFETLCVDLYDGFDAKDAALQSINISRDIEAKIDELLQAYIVPGTTNSVIQPTFRIAGVGGIKPETADFVPHSRVNASNLPTGNLLELTDNTATSSFRLDVVKAIRAYCAAWGSGAFGSDTMPMNVTSIRVPAKDATDIDDGFQATTTTNKFNEQFVDSPWTQVVYNGSTITIIADNTLDPADGICIAQTSMPAGILYDKPELAESHHWGKHTHDQHLIRNNLERFQEIHVYGVAMPRTWRIGTVGVRYRDPE